MQSDMQENAIPNFMVSVKGGLAVVTGGCSGMGLAVATKAATCGMIPVVLDMDTSQFAATEQELKAAGAPEVFSAKADVSSFAELAKIAQEVSARFPPDRFPISLIHANAGYGGPPLLDGKPEAIQRQVEVLCHGVIWTFKAFQERFLAQKEPCALVATSSVMGVINSTGSYGVGKHGCLAVMESLHEELWQRGALHVKTHVLCPGAVATNIMKQVSGGGARRNRPLPTVESAGQGPVTRERAAMLANLELMQSRGMAPSHLADQVFEGIETGKFYLVVDWNQPGMLDPGMTSNAEEVYKERHRRLEAGAPPLYAPLRPGGVYMRAVEARRDEILKSRGEVPAPGAKL